MKHSLLPTLALIAGFALAGCGAHPTGVTSPKKSTSTRALSGDVAAPLAGPAVGDSAVAKLLQAVRAAQNAVPGFTATVDTDDKGPSGSESDEIAVAYKKPSSLHLNMIKATGQAQGATILWTGGSDLQIKLKVGFLPVTTSLAVSDSRLKSKNGWTIKQTETNAIFTVLFDPNAQIKILGQQPGDAGHMLTTVEVKSALSPKPADREVIGIDTTTNLPGLRVLFQGENRLYRMAIKNFKIGAPNASEMSL